jgi:hypothetical protein
MGLLTTLSIGLDFDQIENLLNKLQYELVNQQTKVSFIINIETAVCQVSSYHS